MEAIVTFFLAGICAVLSARQFAEKGVLLNNAYLWASKEARETMDKAPYYRQSAIVFCLLSAVFLVIGISAAVGKPKIQLLEIPLLAGTLIYAIVSSVRLEKRSKK